MTAATTLDPAGAKAVPARRILATAAAQAERDGHENLGFLSESHGFLPREHPSLALPGSHRAWDHIAARLPELFRTLSLRAAFDALPVLPAGTDALPDASLLRAAAILGISAHAYFYADPEPPEGLPESITVPWRQVSDRLGRPAPNLSFIDLNAYNWRLRAGRGSDAVRVENLDLLIPILGNSDERRFQMTPVEMLDVFTPIVGAAVRAQEAVAAGAAKALKRELLLIADVISELGRSFAKVDPNPHSPRYVNPVVWGKTVAPLATPFQDVDPPPGPSGTAIPAFQLLDILFGRRSYTSTIGGETARARAWFPQHWRDFLTAVESVSVPAFVAGRGERALAGALAEAREAYAGDDGLLGRHRLKTFGYLDLSFKAGRSKTLGGFAGSFEDRPWDRMDGELALARIERTPATSAPVRHARVERVELLGDKGATGHVVLDLGGEGVRYRPGSRLAVLPESDPALVERTLTALHARGDEPVQLDSAWLAAVTQRDGFEQARVLPLRTLLTFGRLRPVHRDVAKALYALTHNQTLHAVIEARAEDQWDLDALLILLEDESGFRPASLWKAHPGERHAICAIVAPETSRMYSIASAMAPQADSAETAHLLVGRLAYTTPATAVSRQGPRHGTASAHLTRSDRGRTVPVRVVEPFGFSLPEDPRRAVVMIAGGTGISPFLGMIAARSRQPGAGPMWLYLGTRSRDDVYGGDELREHVAAGALELRVSLSRQDLAGRSAGGAVVWEQAPRRRVDGLLHDDEHARRLVELLLADGATGHVYVCGRTGFAAAVEGALESAAARHLGGLTAGARALNRLNGDGRYAREVYTTYPGPHFAAGRRIDASEVVIRNDPADECWMILSGRVYDLTRFAQLHPGGDKILRSYAGMDATYAYRRAGHDVHPEVDSLLGLYELGALRRLRLGSDWGVAVGPSGLRVVSTKDAYRAWIRLLYRVVEVQNAVANDYGIRHEPVTHDEGPADVRSSPYKSRALFETHRRLVGEHLPGLTDRRIPDLWALTSGLDGEHHDFRWMQRRLTEVLGEPAAAGSASLHGALDESFRRIGAGSGRAVDLDRVETTIAAIEAEDRRLLAGLKAALRDGLRTFERHEAATIAAGAGELRAAAAALPEVIAGYHSRLAALSAP